MTRSKVLADVEIDLAAIPSEELCAELEERGESYQLDFPKLIAILDKAGCPDKTLAELKDWYRPGGDLKKWLEFCGVGK